jgi:hypothetical protein
MLNYNLFLKVKNHEPIQGTMLFDSGYGAREFGDGLLRILAEVEELSLKLRAKEISEISNSSWVWELDHGKLEFKQMSNCD